MNGVAMSGTMEDMGTLMPFEKGSKAKDSRGKEREAIRVRERQIWRIRGTMLCMRGIRTFGKVLPARQW